MGLRQLEGTELPASVTGPPAIVINRTLLIALGGAAVGQSLQVSGRTPQVWQVVGVVDDTRQSGLDTDSRSEIYFDLQRWPAEQPGARPFPEVMWFTVRTDQEPTSVAASVSMAVR